MQRGCFISFYGLSKYFCKIKISASKFKEFCSFANFERKHFMVMKLNISFWTKLIWNGFYIFRNSPHFSCFWLNLLLLLLWISAKNILNHPALDSSCLKERACTEDTCSVVLYLAYPKVTFSAQPLQIQRSSYALLIHCVSAVQHPPCFHWLIFLKS